MRSSTRKFSGRLPLGPLVLSAAALMLCAACQSQPKPQKAQIVVPSTATHAPQYRGDGSIPEENYVIRMSDGKRDWEVSFPSSADGYRVQIPLDGDEPGAGRADVDWETEQLSAADKELLEDMRRQNPDMEREGLFLGDENLVDRQAEREEAARGEEQDSDDGESAEDARGEERDETRESGAQPAPTRPSYLNGIAEVQDLYERGKFELAMVRLARLDEAYPNDVKILSMKGTLWLKLGRESLARNAWERALEIEPDNETIARALERLENR